MPNERSVNKRDHVVLTSFAYEPREPRRLRLRDLALQIEGTTGARTWSGVYGTGSVGTASIAAYRRAEQRSLQSFQIRSWCKLRDLSANSGTAIRRETVQRTGFLDIKRAVPSYREELLDAVLERLAKSLGAKAAERVSSMSLREVMLLHPESAGWILQSEPGVVLLVHEARMCGSQGAQRDEFVHVGTVRTATARTMQSLVVCAEGRIAVTY